MTILHNHTTAARFPRPGARIFKHVRVLTAFSFLTVALLPMAGSTKKTTAATEPGENTAPAVLWSEPTDIETRDLFYGSGGKEHAPAGTKFTFVKEDLNGTNPKFVVQDQDGVKWKVKLGAEAKPETAASRLVWAAGYFTQEDYFLRDLQIVELPAHLHRGGNLIGKDGSLHNAFFKREDKKEESKTTDWAWKHAPFVGTREFNGLRVLMALINNWDLKDVNNAIYVHKEDGEQRYLVTDLGASFGTSNFIRSLDQSRGNLDSYRASKFITSQTAEYVDFETPGRPTAIEMVNPPRYMMRLHLRWIGRRVPRADAQWMGQLLSRLSREQIRDAFRAADYSPGEIEGFAQIVQQRIEALKAL
jgi:hypothetical protein